MDTKDFSELPDVIWVKVMSYLSLFDRKSIALTCHTLNDAFNHPSLWYKATIALLATGPRCGNDDKVHITKQQIELIERFGQYFQNLTLSFMGYVSAIPPHIEDVLAALSQNCRFETLTLNVGTVLSKRDFFWERPDRLDIDPIMVLVEKSYRLRALNIISWPMYRTIRSPNILDAMRKNDKNKHITSLNLFYKKAEDSTWTTLNAQLPSPCEVVKTINFCDNLTTLKLQSTMLNTEVIDELSKASRCSLERLSVLVTYSRHDPTGKLPDISSKAWSSLRDHSPDLRVDFTFVTRMPYVEKATLLKPEIPVSSLNFMKYSECTKEDLLSVIDKYQSTLLKFADFSSSASENIENEISLLVEKCTKLNYFVYAGALSYHTVTALAQARGRQWYYFQVNSENVITTEPSVNQDENAVLMRASDGTYEYASRANYQDELERVAVLEVMTQEVGMHLGQKWLPMDIKERDKEDMVTKIYGNPLIGNRVPTWMVEMEENNS